MQGVADRPHLRVVGRDAVPDQAERRGQPVDQVDGHRDVVLAGQRVGGVDARRAGADDGDPEGAVRGRGSGGTVGGHDWHPDPAGAPAPDPRPGPPISPSPGGPVSVVVVATLTPKPDQVDAVREAILAAVPKVHDEPGCELYAVHEGDGRVRHGRALGEPGGAARCTARPRR